MKKTLLATAIAGAMAFSATAAQAATVYDQDGTKLDVYGRISMGVAGGGPEYDGNDKIDNGAEFVDMYSRLGLRMSQEVTSDLTAFGRVEWRFRGDEAGNRFGNDFDAFSETRQSYIGLRSDSWGTFQGGNFDAFYNQAVSITFDKYIDRGLEFKGHPTQSRGDSIGYITPDLSGFQVYLQGKHYSERGLEDTGTGLPGETSEEGSVIATQGGAVYEIDNLRLALGWVEDVARGNGNGENVYGTTASYEFMPGFSGRIGYETRDESSSYNNAGDQRAATDDNGGGYDTWGVGASYSVNQWTFHGDIYNVDVDTESEGWEDRTAWALGGYYDVSSNFQAFTELYQGDQPEVTVGGGDGDFVETADGDDMYYVVGARYFF